MGGFRIGRKYAHHVYPESRVASTSAADTLRFSNSAIAISTLGGEGAQYLSNCASLETGAGGTPTPPTQTPLLYPAGTPATKAQLVISVTHSDMISTGHMFVRLAVNGIAIPDTATNHINYVGSTGVPFTVATPVFSLPTPLVTDSGVDIQVVFDNTNTGTGTHMTMSVSLLLFP